MHPKLRVAKEFDELQAQVFRLKAEVAVKDRVIEGLVEDIGSVCETHPGCALSLFDNSCKDGFVRDSLACQARLISHYHAKAQAKGEGKNGT